MVNHTTKLTLIKSYIMKENISDYIKKNQEQIFDKLFSLLRIPSISAKKDHKNDMLQCANRWKELLMEAGVDKAEIMETAGNPVVYAEKLIRDKAIGDVVEIRGWGPHRIGSSERPGWFYEKDKYGGILTDIGSHQLEQILTYAGASDATLIASRVGNLHHKAHPGLEDFGDAMFVTDNGIPCYVNVDWFTPDGLGSWGDGRMIIIGTKGYIELRKYIDVAAENTPDHVILVDDKAEYHYKVNGKVGYPFFSAMILDCINGTETAIKQEHVFKAIELAIEAEDKAIHI